MEYYYAAVKEYRSTYVLTWNDLQYTLLSGKARCRTVFRGNTRHKRRGLPVKGSWWDLGRWGTGYLDFHLLMLKLNVTY